MVSDESVTSDPQGAKSQLPDPGATRACFACRHPNPQESRYCGKCAAPLVLSDFIAAAVADEVKGRFADKSSIALEVSEAIQARLESKGTRILTVLGAAFAFVIGALAFFGYTTYSDFKKTTEAARSSVEKQASDATAQITTAGEQLKATQADVERDLSLFRDDVRVSRQGIGTDRASVQRLASDADNAYRAIEKLGSELGAQRRKIETTDAIVTAL